MGLNLLRLYCVADQRSLVDKSGQSYTIPGLTKGDQQTIEFKLLQQEAGSIVSGNPYSEILVANYTLKIGLFKEDGTQLAYRSDWSIKDATTYSGDLALNTAAITAAMGASSSIQTVLEIEITESTGSNITVYQQTVTLKKEFITTATTSVPPEEVAASESWVKSYAMPRVLPAGAVIIMTNIEETFSIELGVNTDGTLRVNNVPLT